MKLVSVDLDIETTFAISSSIASCTENAPNTS